MQPAKGANRERVPQDDAERAISPIPRGAQSVAVLDVRLPAGDVGHPRTELVVDADIVAEHVATPTVMIAGDHRNGNTCIDDVREGRNGAKPLPRNHRLPLEPELE